MVAIAATGHEQSTNQYSFINGMSEHRAHVIFLIYEQ